MPKKTGTNHTDLSSWQVESLRLTAFLTPSAPVDSSNWWVTVVGEHPEKKVSQPRTGAQQEEGQFEGGKLTLAVNPTRIDWLLMIDLEKEIKSGEPSLLGPFPSVLDKFVYLIDKWFKVSPAVQRLAFGAVLLQPVSDRQSGYRKISSFLPSVDLDIEGSSDFLYQINRPRGSESGISGLKINRLSKWSVRSLSRFQISMGTPSPMHSIGQENFYCSLELDINTSQDFRGDLQPQQIPRIFQELVDFSKEIAEKGDIA